MTSPSPSCAPGIGLRPFRPADAHAITEWVTTREELRGFLGGDEHWPLTAEVLIEAAGRPGIRAWSARLEPGPDSVVGHIERVRVDEAEARLARVILSPAVRGLGLGRLLVEAALAELCVEGFQTASLYVVPGNEPAERAYRAAGFRVTDPAPEHPEWTRMVRPLTS